MGKKELNKIKVSGIIGPNRPKEMNAEEFLRLFPEDWQPELTEALYECLRRGWQPTENDILTIARENDRKQRAKG